MSRRTAPSTRRRAAVLALALLGVAPLAGCTAHAQATVSAPMPAPSVAGTATCIDPSGDGVGGVDLIRVTLTDEPDGLHARFQLAAPPPTWNGVALSISLWTGRNAPVRALTVRWKDHAVGEYAYDVTSASVRYLPAAAASAGSTVTATFPPSVLSGLGRSWRWAASTVDKSDDPGDDCPQTSGAGGPPQLLPFPGPTTS